ncbi:MAG: DUF6477 family protein [Pseudomonadota bacterium]
MLTPLTQLSRLTRPSMLVRAARFGAAAKVRGKPRRTTSAAQPSYEKLFEEEARLDEARRSGDAGYSPTRHVEVLANLLTAAGYGALPPA